MTTNKAAGKKKKPTDRPVDLNRRKESKTPALITLYIGTAEKSRTSRAARAKKGVCAPFLLLVQSIIFRRKTQTAKIYIARHSSAGSGAGRRPAATGCAPAPHNEELCTVGMWNTPVNRWETCFSIREPISVFQHFHSVPIRQKGAKQNAMGAKDHPRR